MKFLLLAVLIGFCTNLFCQGFGKGVENQTNINQLVANDPTSVVRQYDDRYAGVKGSPFLRENFCPGNVTMSDGKIYKASLLNYNAHEDELMFKKGPADPPMVVKKNSVTRFEIDSTDDNQYRLFKKFDFNGQGASGFYAVIYEGKIKLLCRISKLFTKANYAGAYSGGQEYDRFTDQFQYFVISTDGTLAAFKPNIQSLQNISPTHTKEIKNFLKEKKISLKKLPDLVKAFKYLDSL